MALLHRLRRGQLGATVFAGSGAETGAAGTGSAVSRRTGRWRTTSLAGSRSRLATRMPDRPARKAAHVARSVDAGAVRRMKVQDTKSLAEFAVH